VTFTWLPATDPDGDTVSQFLVYSPHADFSFPTTRQVETVPAIVMAAGGLLLAALLAGLINRRNFLLGLTLMVLVLEIVACGGGGSGGGDDSVSDDQRTSFRANILLEAYCQRHPWRHNAKRS
jgi:hypothetical protein